MLSKADIKLIRSLGDKSGRTASGLFVVEGRKMVGEALASGFEVERIFAAGSPDGMPASDATGVDNAERIAPREMERISMLKTPPDMLALVRIPRRKALTPETLRRGLTIVLDDIQDPGNLGTIIRTADWFGIENIVCSPATADCYNPKVVQATMGALFRVGVHYAALPDFLAGISDAGACESCQGGIPIYGTFLDGENIYEAGLSQTGIVVMGNEGSGISAAVAASVSHRLFIPPFPSGRSGSESLNVATATAIICSEFRRRVHGGNDSGNS